MRMFSKDGQCMVDVKKMEYVDGEIAMTAKLMGAYSMKIYLPPEELRAALTLINGDLVKCMPNMLISGTQCEDQLRQVGEKLAAANAANMDVLLGEDSKAKLSAIGKAIGSNTAETLLDSVLMLLPVIFANKTK